MKTLLLLAACLAYVSADCGPLEALKVKSQWAVIYGSDAAGREHFAELLWDNFFDHHPEARDIFSRVRGDNIYSNEFHAHAIRVFGGLDICISLLSDTTTLNAALAHLKGQHDDRNLDAKLFDYFWDALSHAIPAYEKHIHFDYDAWHDCYSVIRTGITG